MYIYMYESIFLLTWSQAFKTTGAPVGVLRSSKFLLMGPCTYVQADAYHFSLISYYLGLWNGNNLCLQKVGTLQNIMV